MGVAWPGAASAFIVVESKDGSRLVASAATWFPPSGLLVVLPDGSERKFEPSAIARIVDDHGRDRTRYMLEEHGTVGRPPSTYQSRLGAGSFPLQSSAPAPFDSAALLVPMVRVEFKSDSSRTVMFAAWRPPKQILLHMADGTEMTVEADRIRKISDAMGKERTGFVTKGEGAVGVLPAGYGGPVTPEQFVEKEAEDPTSLEEIGLVALLVAALATSMAFVIGVK
ncbi:MAG TPA: hypothetical protein VFS09_08605 [Candidatus Eisenbacteria bacterium]|nr:hypothetical protein [Candidatus Eisenbacteria bacterium]